jgi:hypothetical protein
MIFFAAFESAFWYGRISCIGTWPGSFGFLQPHCRIPSKSDWYTPDLPGQAAHPVGPGLTLFVKEFQVFDATVFPIASQGMRVAGILSRGH